MKYIEFFPISYEVIITEDCVSKQDFIDKYNLYNFDVISENDNLTAGDIVIIYLKQTNKISKIYVVKPKDTFEIIAKKFNISVEKIKADNKCNTLFIGQQLFINFD